MKSWRIFIIYILGFLLSPVIALAQEWSQPERISGYQRGENPFILAIDNFVHVTYVGHGNPDEIRYVRSSDEGQTWSTPISINPDLFFMGSPKLVGFGSMLLCAWEYQTSIPTHANIDYRISTDNGVTWLPLHRVIHTDLDSPLRFSISNSDEIINICAVYLDGGGSIYNIRSSDFGLSWSEQRLLYPAYQYSGTCDQASSGDYVHFVWSGSFPGGGLNLNYANSSDGGVTWSECVPLNGANSWYQNPRVSSNSNGHVGVTWVEYGPLRFRQSFDFGVNWDSTITVGVDGERYGYSDIAIDDSSIYLAWMQNQSSGPGLEAIYFTKSGDNGQNWDSQYWIDREDQQSLDPKISISNGVLYVVWQDWQEVPGSVYFSRYPDFPDAIDEEAPVLPEILSLSAYPNPFNSSTSISYRGLVDGSSLCIYDIAGRLVRIISLDSKSGNVTWDAKDNAGRTISSGVYFVRASNSNIQSSLKIILLK